MRLPLPGPHDVRQLLEQLLAAGPRVLRLIGEAEKLLERVNRVVDDIDATRAAADDVVADSRQVVTHSRDVVDRSREVVARSDDLLAVVGPLNDRVSALLDGLEPSLSRLQPILERLAETTSPAEVDAIVALVDQMPRLAQRMEVDIMPVLDSLNSVAPDLHDLLDVSRELNLMLAKIPGMGRVKDKVDEQQEAEGRG
jgi:ElaB/YqjD/DUF883 family membrane-anchored ribosome-binding protein